MNSTHIILATAVLAGISLGFLPAQEINGGGVLPVAADKVAVLGTQSVDVKTAADVRTNLAQVVNDGLTMGRFPALIEHLAKQDRDRIGNLEGEKYDELNKAITQFRDEFRVRYHQDFQLRPEQLKDAAINFGRDKNLVTVSLSDLEKNSAVNPAPAVDGLPIKDPNSKDIPNSTGLSVNSGPVVDLINEGKATQTGEPGLWKVNVPNEVGGRQIKENLTKHLKKLADQRATWSDDPNATARAVASQVFQALSDSSLATVD